LRPRAILVVVVAVALALRLFGLGRESLWLDEGVAIRMASLPLRQTIAATAADVHPPLFRALLHVVIALGGRSEAAARLLSALAGTLAVLLLGRIGTRLSGSFVGLGAAGLLAVSPLAVQYAQDATSYSLYMCVALVSYLYLLRWLERRRTVDGVGYVLATSALLYTHNTAWFVVVAQWTTFGMALLRAPTPRPQLALRWILLQAATMALYAPWASVLARQLGAVSTGFWIPTPTLRTLGSTLLDYAGTPWMLAALGIATLAGLVPVRPRGEELNTAWPAPELVLVPWLVLPVALPFLASYVFAPIFLTRVTLAALPALCLVAMRGVSALRGPVWRPVCTALLVLGTAQPLISYHRGPHKERWREAVSELETLAAPGDLVLVHAGFCKPNVVDYYLRRRDLEVDPFPEGHWAIGQADVSDLKRRIAGRSRVWLLRSHEGEGSAILGETLARALPDVRERSYPQADYRWSPGPPHAGVALVSYQETGSDPVPAPVTETGRGVMPKH
jgi:hypothetical protein